jgi:hypothetical protein
MLSAPAEAARSGQNGLGQGGGKEEGAAIAPRPPYEAPMRRIGPITACAAPELGD